MIDEFMDTARYFLNEEPLTKGKGLFTLTLHGSSTSE